MLAEYQNLTKPYVEVRSSLSPLLAQYLMSPLLGIQLLKKDGDGFHIAFPITPDALVDWYDAHQTGDWVCETMLAYYLAIGYIVLMLAMPYSGPSYLQTARGVLWYDDPLCNAHDLIRLS